VTRAKLRPDPEERARQRDAAYERGWVDSLRACQNVSQQPVEDAYDYQQGWNECAKYRWEDPANDGCAPDPNYRKPRA
jgi:hypothetical protein